jgi:hypothetical protein
VFERWWHPENPVDAHQAATEVEEAFVATGQTWFESAATLAGARAALYTTVLPDLWLLGAMELDELGAVSPAVKAGLARWCGEPLVDWLLAR